MKRSLFVPSMKQTLLAVPAAALMLGAAQAGTTVGLNFQSWYYDSGTNPQTVGFGQGYQTTGFPVTAPAFGVAAANWVNTDPQNCSAPLSTSVTIGSVTANLNAVNPWSGDIGNLVDPDNEWDPAGPTMPSRSSVLPGNDEVTWGYEDNTGWTNSLSGLNTDFPNGYIIELVGAVKCTTDSRVVITDGITTTTNAFDTIYTAGNVNFPGPVGLLAFAGTSDSITFGAASRNINSAQSCGLAGFIITDQPVVTKDPASTSVNQGDTLVLSANSIGLTNGLHYQWQHAGTNILGANDATYIKAGITADDAGDYDLIVTNLYGAATSGMASVDVIAVPAITQDLTGVAATIYSGANFSGWSIVAAGGLPLQYNWLKNGTTPAGGDSPTLTLTNVSAADSGDYAVTVVNSYGSAQSATNHLTVLSSPNLYTTDVVQDSPSAFWPLNESSGTNANDYSGNGNTGNNNGGITLGVDGPRPPAYQGFDAANIAYQFDGGSAYIDCGTAPSLAGTTDFTLEAWINTTATANGMIIQQRSATGFNGEYQFQLTAGGNLNFTIYGGGAQQYNFTTTRTVNDGQWHYVAAVRSGANGYIYIDGTLAASASGTPAPLDATIATYIGSDQRDAVSYFNGALSDVAIYDAALSAHSITLHAYNGLKGNAPFAISIVPGGYVADTKPAGSPHYGLNHNAAWTNSITDFNFPAVTRDGVAVFSGNSQLAIPADTDFDSANGTIVFWLQANAPIPGPGNEGAMLFDRRTTNGVIIALYDDGAIHWQGQNGSQNAFAGGYVPDNNWHLIAVTYGQSVNDTLAIYVDGQLAGSTIVTNGWSWPTGQEIEIGRSHDSYWKALNGQMDDFRIYNRVLTDTEIGQIYTSDALVDTAALVVRYNFDTAGAGQSLSWPAGVLESSSALGSAALWTTISNAIPPYPFMPPAPAAPTGPALFYRAGF